MQKRYKAYKDLTFPAFVIQDRVGEYKIYDIASRWSDFLTLGRVPAVGTYNLGYVFDAAGRVYRYEAESGWPRFSRRSKSLLEALILPGLLFKLVAYFVYYGPEVLPGELLELSEFRRRIFERLQVYEKGRDARQLSRIINRATSYIEVINGIEWYRVYGGRRDENGHFLNEDERQPGGT